MTHSRHHLVVGVLALLAWRLDARVMPKLVQSRSDTPGNQTYTPFHLFIQEVKDASLTSLDSTFGIGQDDFDEMKFHILNMYSGVSNDDITSFLLQKEHIDCISITEQPSFHLLKLKEIEIAPHEASLPKLDNATPDNSTNVDSTLHLGSSNEFGNQVSCPELTIPIVRLTLQKMIPFKTLKSFFAKSPNADEIEPAFEPSHLHAHAYQDVENWGGSSWLNIWNPRGDFSISQQWYVGGSGCDTQTVEGGLQVYPDKYGSTETVLFIYWTRHNYGASSCETEGIVGCYNLDCPGFVQVSKSWVVGMHLKPYSITDGLQYGIEMQWHLTGGIWWLLVKGSKEFEAVGYYPASIFQGGQLSKSATRIDFGGEVARKVGSVWPEMGNGQFAEQGWQKAAFQKSAYWTDQQSVTHWTDLTTHSTGLETCYTINLLNDPFGGTWGTHFYYGGPGGNVCTVV